MAKQKLEAQIQREIIAFLRARGWFVRAFHGNLFQSGVPDLFLAHPTHGFRWVDVKRPHGYALTRAQEIEWPVWDACGVGIWIMTAATLEEYAKLFASPNWRAFAGRKFTNKVNELDRFWKGQLDGVGARSD